MGSMTRLITSSTGKFNGTNAKNVNDIFLFNGNQYASPFTGIIDGLGGGDAIAFVPSSSPILTALGNLTAFNLSQATIRGIEALTFAGKEGDWLQVTLGLNQAPASGLLVQGSDGRDGLMINAFGAGDHLMPLLFFEGWEAGGGSHSDYVALLGTNNLFARDGLDSLQVLTSFTPGASLTGSDGQDVLTVNVSGSGNMLSGRGGDDVLSLSAVQGQTLTLTNASLDGGSGDDQLRVQGHVHLINPDIENVDEFFFAPSTSFPGQTFPAANLVIDVPFSTSDPQDNLIKPLSLVLAGEGRFTLNLAAGVSFDGRGISHAADADIVLIVNGSAASDAIAGTTGDERLFGHGGEDFLKGLDGDDILAGGAGRDDLTGGAGNDIFLYLSAADSLPGANRDVVRDFHHTILEHDRIDLHLIDANAHLSGDQAFFLGGSQFTHKAGEIIQVRTNGNMVVLGDVDGDGSADLSILLMKVTAPLASDDFIL